MTSGGDSPRPTLRVLASELDAPEPARQQLSAKATEFAEGEARKAKGGARGGRTSGSAPPRKGQPARGEIYDGCPVKALGVHGKVSWYIDWLGQIRDVSKHDRDTILHIFGGREEELRRHFKRQAKSGDVIGWDQSKAAAAMQRAAADQGIWNPLQRLRGRGAWTDGDGGLILHCGDAVLHRGVWHDPGELEGFVYPSAPRIPRPLPPGPEVESAPDALLELLDTWSWQRRHVDAFLLLGWIGCALFGGALPWRPLVWITGDAGTGKSTLQGLIGNVLGGEGALLQSSDATPASLWQMLGTDALPVALDEVEPDVDSRTRVSGVIKLARQAASGGVILRGGSDHKGSEFKARSCFLLSSILRPAMLDQDISRMALLELEPLGRGVTPPSLRPDRMRQLGRALRTRIIDQWPRWHQTLELYRAALARQGHNARGADQFGTLLAMADMCMEDAVPLPGRCDGWAAQLAASLVGEQTDQARDWQRLATWLLGQQVEAWRGGSRFSIGALLLAAACLQTTEERETGPSVADAKSFLPRYGIRVQGTGRRARVWIANSHPLLANLFRDTQWWAGAGQTGVWAQSLRRVPGAVVPKSSTRFDGRSVRYMDVPLVELLDLSAEPDEAPTDTPED
ncbi:putative DNA primase/helicase [Albimonas donghaensis]|uniref:Putative DNA primase/helicase n=1 Tax=Albimonas donghaensis TaxID=356660 RepID=A0A1H2R8J7_9RHOB|nr:hypothetical protein [Albimonas donghaensis]SDW15803.1 putative DNA primase/helicase [Albimonas donghaensis]